MKIYSEENDKDFPPVLIVFETKKEARTFFDAVKSGIEEGKCPNKRSSAYKMYKKMHEWFPCF